MQNEVFSSVSAELALLLGPGEPLASGNGTRYRSTGGVTVYHERIATGNQAEIAFEPASIASALSIEEIEVRTLVETLRRGTGREINFNRQFRWPRVGIVNYADAQFVVDNLRENLFLQLSRHA